MKKRHQKLKLLDSLTENKILDKLKASQFLFAELTSIGTKQLYILRVSVKTSASFIRQYKIFSKFIYRVV